LLLCNACDGSIGSTRQYVYVRISECRRPRVEAARVHALDTGRGVCVRARARRVCDLCARARALGGTTAKSQRESQGQTQSQAKRRRRATMTSRSNNKCIYFTRMWRRDVPVQPLHAALTRITLTRTTSPPEACRIAVAVRSVARRAAETWHSSLVPTAHTINTAPQAHNTQHAHGTAAQHAQSRVSARRSDAWPLLLVHCTHLETPAVRVVALRPCSL
jgi:hypothetical protein